MTKALLFIRTHRPDIFSVDFLKDNPSDTKKLADAYDNIEGDSDACQIGISYLDEKRPTNLINLKDSCEQHLLKYIESRGKLNESGIFNASNVTKFFRNTVLTELKIREAQQLIKEVRAASSLDELQYKIKRCGEKKDASQGGWFNSEFSACLGLCQMISNLPLSSTEPQHRLSL